MSRTSVSSRTREGTLLTAPGNTSQMPTVPTVSMAPVDFAADFKRENQFGCGGQRVFAAGHQLAAGVSAFAFNHDALAGRRGDVRDQAHVDSFLLKKWALLNVQLDELMKAAARHGDRFERACESGVARATLPVRGLPCRAARAPAAG